MPICGGYGTGCHGTAVFTGGADVCWGPGILYASGGRGLSPALGGGGNVALAVVAGGGRAAPACGAGGSPVDEALMVRVGAGADCPGLAEG